MAALPTRIEINIAAIPVRGFGGMCMVLASLVCAASLPETRWFMIAGLAAGAVLGGAMIAMRKQHASRRAP